MKSHLLLTAALALLLPALPVVPVFAQDYGPQQPQDNTRGARKAAEARKHTSASQAPTYPGATRKSPEQVGDKAVAKDMEALIKLQSVPDSEDKVIAHADAVLNNPKANAFDKSSAAYLAGAAWQNKDTSGYGNAIKYYQIALDNNGLANDNHFRTMLQLSQLLAVEERHAEALAMVDRFLAETKSDDATAWAIKSQILLALNRPKDAVTALEKLLAAKPNDKKAMMNLAAAYVESDQDAKAGQMFDRMRAAGLLTDSKDYETGVRLVANIKGRDKDALSMIEEGFKSGVLKPSYEMYALQGRIYFEADDSAKTLAAWSLAAPLSKDGEMYLNVGKLQLQGNHYAEAKAAALSAQSKGVKKVGEVYELLARAEHGLHNAAASKAALQEAAKYPETKKWAEAALRQGLGE